MVLHQTHEQRQLWCRRAWTLPSRPHLPAQRATSQTDVAIKARAARGGLPLPRLSWRSSRLQQMLRFALRPACRGGVLATLERVCLRWRHAVARAAALEASQLGQQAPTHPGEACPGPRQDHVTHNITTNCRRVDLLLFPHLFTIHAQLVISMHSMLGSAAAAEACSNALCASGGLMGFAASAQPVVASNVPASRFAARSCMCSRAAVSPPMLCPCDRHEHCL